MTDLSPAAQTVLDAVSDVRIDADWWPEGMPDIVAAALRAIAKVALPRNARGMVNRQELRAYILSIANEIGGD
jgi:hypothetical protein